MSKSDDPILKVPVLVVGAGPAGLAASLLLQQYGVQAVTITRYAWMANTPRAHHFNPRAVEMLRGLGLEEHFRGVAMEQDLVRNMARFTLERCGFTVEQAADGRDAVEKVTARPSAFSAVLLDLTMPVMSGEEALIRIQEIRPDLPVLLSSGFSEAEAVKRFADRGLAVEVIERRPCLGEGCEGKRGRCRGQRNPTNGHDETPMMCHLAGKLACRRAAAQWLGRSTGENCSTRWTSMGGQS